MRTAMETISYLKKPTNCEKNIARDISDNYYSDYRKNLKITNKQTNFINNWAMDQNSL